MEPFAKVRRREQRMISDVMWRGSLAQRLLTRFGLVGGALLITKCKPGFDVQLEKHDAVQVVWRFRKESRALPFIVVSFN